MTGFAKEELEKALVAITSLVEKSEKAKVNLTKGHLTLIENRIRALRISMALISESLKGMNEFPKLSAPALRALANANITTLAQLSKYTEKEIAALHGIGPSAFPALHAALKGKKLSFKK